MAYKDFDGSLDSTANTKVIQSDGQTIDLPDASYVRDAAMTRDGMDLLLDSPHGQLVIKGYFADDSQPNLVAPDGSTLTPDLVNSFAHSPAQYAGSATVNDESPVGLVQEVTGNATVTHLDGSKEAITKGTPIYQGDVVETDAQGAVNIKFLDETTFAVSEDARLAIDEYVYDPSTQSGETNFSVLKGVFVFTSGLIGRDDPDDVQIDTPVGSIGIRGTIIAGNVNTGEITVVEGAIVLTDHAGHEMTLASQFETARFHGNDGIEHIGQLSAADVAQKFFVVSQVSPTLFSSINDAAAEETQQDAPVVEEPKQEEAPVETAPQKDGLNETATDAPVTQGAVALPPVPPPVAPQTVTGFTSTTSGLTVKNLTATYETDVTQNAQTLVTQTVVNTTAAAGTNEALPVMAPPANDPTQTDTSGGSGGGGGGGGVGTAPVFRPEAPSAFFNSSETQSWQYRFDKEFRDDGGQANLTYQLSAQTITDLTAWEGNILNAGGWSFNATTGQLSLNFSPASPAPPQSALNIQVQAVDSDNNVSGYQSWTFQAHNAASNAPLPMTFTTNNTTVSTLTPTTNTEVNSDASTLFLGDGNDTITINTGTNNRVFLGDGVNNAIVQLNGNDNVIVGGDNRDFIELANARNEVYAMDGNDNIRIVLGGTNVITDLYAAGTGAVIDGGHSNFQAALGLGLGNLQGEAGGRGDSLVLWGAGSLNFTNVNAANQISSIERIDMAESTAGQSVTLSYADILRITDDKNALIINLGGNDQLFLTGMSGMSLVHDDVSIDDGDTTTVMRNYDVYTDGNVTILISAQGAAAANGVQMDGSTVAI